MILKRSFCAECGITDVPLHESFCQKCYWKNNKIAKPLKSRIEVVYCLTCAALKLPSGWTGTNAKIEIPEIISHAYNKKLNIHSEALIMLHDVEEINWNIPNPEFIANYRVSIDNIAEFKAQKESFILNFKLSKGICKTCVKKKTGSSDVIVQFRALHRSIHVLEKDVTTNIAFELVNNLSYDSPDSYLGDIVEVHGGLDFYFGNTMIAEEFISRLKNLWIGHHEKNYKLVTEDKEKKRVYSVTHLYRIPYVRRGDIINYLGELHEVDLVSKTGVHVRSLYDQSHVLIKDWKNLNIADPAPFPVKKIILSEDTVNSSYLIMDVKNFTTEEININQFKSKLPIGEEVILLSWQDKYYFKENSTKHTT